MRELGRNKKCPSKSGKNYSNCCKHQSFKWMVDKNGDCYRRTPLVPEAVEALDRALEYFFRVFERAPNEDEDPVFLWKYVIGEDELERQTMELMAKAGMEPQLIYAYHKTGGLLVSRENKKLMTIKDLQDWHNAIDEYYEIEESLTEPDPHEVMMTLLEEELDSCIICLGYVLEYGCNSDAERIPSSSDFFCADDYALICATKSMKTLRAIKVLIEQHIGADALSLARHLLENYLHIVYAISRPEMLKHVIDAQVGLRQGTHEFAKTKNGRVDSRLIIRKSDGAEYIGHISYHKMAESSPHSEDLELFDYIYSFLSEYTHPSFTGTALVLTKDGHLNPLSNELRSEAIFYSICFSIMILNELRQLPLFSMSAKADITKVVSRVRKQTVTLINSMLDTTRPSKGLVVLRDRLGSLVI